MMPEQKGPEREVSSSWTFKFVLIKFQVKQAGSQGGCKLNYIQGVCCNEAAGIGKLFSHPSPPYERLIVLHKMLLPGKK